MSSVLLYLFADFMFLFISCLCGEGARQWAEENGVPVCNPEDLITGNYIIIAI